MTTISEEFRNFLSDVQESVSKAEFMDNWVPPGSPAGVHYNCVLTDVQDGGNIDEETGARSVWIRLGFRIADGEHDGKDFSVFFSSKRASFMGPLFYLASQVASDPSILSTKNLLAARESLGQSAGNVLVAVIVKEVTRKGKTYTNFSFDGVQAV